MHMNQIYWMKMVSFLAELTDFSYLFGFRVISLSLPIGTVF
jgi:hypothetical protein